MGRLSAMADAPESRYAKGAEGSYLAFQVVGGGPIDLVFPVNGGVLIDLMWEEPAIAAFVRRLASFSRVITFDPRGFGSSGHVNPQLVPAVQTWMDDLITVMDAAESERAAFLTWGESALAVMLLAATHPRRVRSLVLVNSYARYLRGADNPWAMPPQVLDQYLAAIELSWGTGTVASTLAPSLVSSEEARRRWARVERLSATPDSAAVVRAFLQSDVTDVLPSIQAPTLVISRRDDRHVRAEHSRYLASRIKEARLLELDGDDDAPYSGDADEILDDVQEFITGVRPTPVVDRVLATVLFTDIVGSTQQAVQLGDRRWRESLDRYDDLVRRQLDRFRGRQVNTTGDGTLATFDGPARAVQCARSLVEAVSHLGIQIRAGLHTGEVEARGNDVAGLAVHIAARVSALANSGEVLVSRTVTDLVAGSGLKFDDRGEHELKGVPGSWRLFSAS